MDCVLACHPVALGSILCVPKNFSLGEIFSSCCWDLLTALPRTVDRGLIMSSTGWWQSSTTNKFNGRGLGDSKPNRSRCLECEPPMGAGLISLLLLSFIFILYFTRFLIEANPSVKEKAESVWNLSINKCRPILVQGLRRGFEILRLNKKFPSNM